VRAAALPVVSVVHHRHVGGPARPRGDRGRAHPGAPALAGLHPGLQRGLREPRCPFSAAGQFLLDYRDWIRIAGGGLIIVFGLYIAGVLRIGIFGRTRQLQIQSKPAGLLGSFLVGLTFAIGWTPCVGPILGSILTLASNDRTVGQGITLLLCYSAGLGLPFLLSSVALGSFLRFFKRYRPFIPTVERAAGGLLVIVGVLVATNYYVLLNSWAISLTPEWLLKHL
jgi:cytochrome c-type biogenesis protein